MSQMTVDLPESVSEAEAKLQLAARLFAIGRLSCGQAAELAGYSKRTFMELLGKLGVPVLDYPVGWPGLLQAGGPQAQETLS